MTCVCGERVLSNPTRQIVPAFAMTAGEDNDTSTAVFGVATEMREVSSLMTWTHRPCHDELKMMGYRFQFSPGRRYWTITPAGWDRPIGLYRLGAEYTEERIRQRVYENDISVRERRFARAAYYPNRYNLRRRVDRIMGRSDLEKLYLRYCYELGFLPKYNQKPARLHPLLREDLLKCEMYSQQARLLCRNGIETEADLLLHMERIRKRSEEIMRRRQDLQRLVRRKSVSEDEKAK